MGTFQPPPIPDLFGHAPPAYPNAPGQQHPPAREARIPEPKPQDVVLDEYLEEQAQLKEAQAQEQRNKKAHEYERAPAAARIEFEPAQSAPAKPSGESGEGGAVTSTGIVPAPTPASRSYDPDETYTFH